MRFSSIRTAMAVIIGVVIVLVQSALIYCVGDFLYSTNVSNTKHELDIMAATLAKSAAEFGDQQMERVRGFSKIPLLRSYLKTGQGEEEVLELVKAMSLASQAVNTFYVLDTTGTQRMVVAQGKAGKPNPLADREYVQAVLAGKEGYSTAPTKSIATGKLIVTVTAPVQDADGKVLGGVGMSYSLDNMLEDFIDSIKLGKTGHPFILSPKGTVAGHPDKDLLLKDITSEKGIGTILASPARGEGTVVVKGKERLVAWSQVPGWQWVMAFSMERDEVEGTAREARNYMLAFGAGAIVLLIAVCLFALEKMVVKPLKYLDTYASDVAHGDLDKPCTLTLHNEIGKLADNLRSMVAALKGKIAEADEKSSAAEKESAKACQATLEAEEARRAAESAKIEGMLQAAIALEGVVKGVTAASHDLSSNIEQSSRGSEEQAQRVGETATAMEEMNATVLEVARNASKAAETADKAKSMALDGSRIVTQAVQGISDVQRQAVNMKQDMTTLGQQAQGIGQILTVISDIADQTNLLALNAAIEAARAGDAGRGFAVVADEVRKLAEKTMAATKEVGDAIRGVQDGTTKNIRNMDQAVTTIETATGLANKSGDALNEIVSLVELTTDQVRSIATASEQQSAASEEINRSIEDVSRISSDTSQAMRQSADAVGELARQAKALKGLIDKMQEDCGTQASGPKALS